MGRFQLITALAKRASLAGDFNAQVQQFVTDARTLAADGLTLAEVAQLFQALIVLAVQAATQLTNAGAQKKDFVLQAVAYLYDAIAPSIPLPFFVQPFRFLLRPHVRNLVLAIADGVIEVIYARLKAPQPA